MSFKNYNKNTKNNKNNRNKFSSTPEGSINDPIALSPADSEPVASTNNNRVITQSPKPTPTRTGNGRPNTRQSTKNQRSFTSHSTPGS